MPNVLLSDREWSFLAGEPSDYLKLYLVVKQRMDFATRIAGLKTRINETVLRDAYVVDPVQGRAKPKPITRQRYRSGMARLEKLGLLERIGTLVFFFPQAPLPKFAQNNNNQKISGQQPLSDAALQAVNASAGKAYSVLSEEENTVQQPKPSDNNNLLPALKASNLLTSSSPAAQSEETTAEMPISQSQSDTAASTSAAPAQFPMFLDWQPNRSSLETLASHLGVSLDGFTDEVLAGFTAYWTFDQEECQKTQKQWERQLVLHLEHKRQYAEKQAQRVDTKAEKQAAELSASGVKPEKVRKAASGKVIPLRAVPPTVPATEQPEQQEQAMPSVQATDELMTVLYRKLRGMYGYTFERHYPTENDFDWSSVLGDLTRDQILAGLRRLIEQCSSDPYGAYAPSAIRFRQVCLQIPGLPDVKRAWHEAVNAHYSHAAVEHAAKVTGLSALQSAKSGLLDAMQMRHLRDRFEISFQQVKERLQKGEPLAGREAVTREYVQQRQEAYPEYERLKRLIECGERSKACNDLRRQAQQARQQIVPLCEQFGFEPLPTAPVSSASTNVQPIRQGRAG